MKENKKKRNRRFANGEGSIICLDGKRKRPYAVRLTVGWTKEGKQKFKYLSYHEKIVEAKNALREYLVNPYNLETQTLKTVFDAWMEKADLKEGTAYNHNNSFKKLEHLHNKEINKITLKELEQTLENYKPTVQKTIRKTLRNCFKYALKHDYVTKDITQHLDVDKHTNVKDINIFTVEEINELWDNVGSSYYDDIPLILLYTGLRISELFNLKTSEVDLENGIFNITDSKTKNGIRVLPIHKKIVPLIKKRYNPDNIYLIVNKNNNQVDYTNFIKYHWKVNHTRHEARHTFVSYLTKCVDDRVSIKQIVGHSKKDITDHYTHRSIEEVCEAINRLEYK